jgi:DNA (cytosine-5)-methyltransferase 1
MGEMMDDLTYGSICTGYDGISLGLRIAGLPIRPLWHAENEPSVAQVLKRERPDVPNVGDVKLAPWFLAPHVRLMSSGDPCQSISIAGRQQGREDDRFLWPFVRIAYRAARPDALFFENVANIVSHDGGRTLAERFEHLRADGYAVRWTVLGACAVGAPHHRHRWYALAARWTGPGPVPEAVRVGGKKAICGAPRSGGRFLLPMARDGDGRGEGDVAYWSKRASTGRTNGMPLGAAVAVLLPTPDASMSTRGGMHSPEGALRRISGTGDAKRHASLDDAIATLLPSPTARDGTSGPGRTANREGADDLRTTVARLLPTPMVSDAQGGHSEPQLGGTRPGGAKRMDTLGSAARLLPTPTAGDADRGTGSIGSTGAPMLGAAALEGRWGKFAEAVALWEVITGVPAPAPTEPGAKGAPRLAPALPEWMMGLRPGLLTDELSRPDALKAAGNGCVPLAVAAAYQLLARG